MSELRTIFRRCPNCGRHFEIRITSKKLLDEKVVSEKFRGSQITPPGTALTGPYPLLPTPSLMSEGVIYIDEKEFQYAYECKHCGHKWCEIVEKEDEAPSFEHPKP